MSDPLTTAMADRRMRLAHLLWHGVREVWNTWTPTQQLQFQNLYPDCVPRHPSLDEHGSPIVGNGAGKDFLYMHRTMFEMAKRIASGAGIAAPAGWAQLPAAQAPNIRVPRGWRLPESVYLGKNDDLWNRALAEAQQILQTDRLQQISLDELGTRIEYGIHAMAHQRFGGYSASGALRPGNLDLFQPVNAIWDDTGYDSLLDAYSAQVNAIFWNIHGWIDAQITTWETANKQTADWTDAWLGPMAMNDSGMMMEMKMKSKPHHQGGSSKIDLESLARAAQAVAPRYGGYFFVRRVGIKSSPRSKDLSQVAYRGRKAGPAIAKKGRNTKGVTP